MDNIRVTLTPTPGFCVKSVALQAALCRVTPPQSAESEPPAPRERLHGPRATASTLAISKGVKVFVNIAYDANVPPPPEGSEDVIERAMNGADILEENNPDGWFVPVVVSEPREDKDKAGKPSIVFDCVYHSSLKSRALHDVAFKTFLIELAFQRIEASYAVPLARQIGTPNLKAKGELHPRTVLIPTPLFPQGHPALVSGVDAAGDKAPAKKLIEEISPPVGKPTSQPKGILKKSDTAGAKEIPRDTEMGGPVSSAVGKKPELSWSKNALKEGLQIYLTVPELTHAQIPTATLDVEPRRLMLSIPPIYALDLNLDLPDMQIRDNLQLSKFSVDQALMLKRQRDLDVDNAKAEWRVDEGRLVIHA